MRLTGNHIVHAVPARVWEKLMDPYSLAKVVPGISSLEKVAENSFSATLNIKIGPVNSTFTGNLQLEDIIEEKIFTLKTQQHSRIGNADADIQINLAPVDDNHTDVVFDGDIKVSGMLASMGQRLIGGIATVIGCRK